ncbi:class I SAM-dependent methyltransferase [Acetobacter sp.]|uniref:class I SAM-dependent methyltransferase n=1 Tax=Acetobacter sp. TaxID=440 RepID=UPI0039E76219
MKLYVGSRDYKPEGYASVDIDPAYNPDILCDITKGIPCETGSIEEIVAGHVLEHLEWPDSFWTLAEFSRILQVGGILKVAIPDMTLLTRMAQSGDSAFHAIGLIYGTDGRINRFQQHRYGFTASMIIDILEVLGFTNFDWWNSNVNDASNGWIPREEDEHMAISLNVMAAKATEPAVDVRELHARLIERPTSDFNSVAAEVGHTKGISATTQCTKLYQRIHFKLIEAQQRIKYLEDEIKKRENV